MATTAPAVPAPFVASPAYDRLLLIFSPVLALIAAYFLPAFGYFFEETSSLGERRTRVEHFIAIWTSSHLVAVLFRSHLNAKIRQQYPLRFVAVPALLLLSILVSQKVWVACFVLAVLWDIYHSSMQNFGIGRIYDGRMGNNPLVGRRLDMGLAHVLYIAPILAGGLTLTKSLGVFNLFGADPWYWEAPVRLLVWMGDWLGPIRWTVIAGSLGFIAYYLIAYARLRREGYKVSPNKVWLYVSVAVSSSSWFLMDFIAALFVVNLYHALQYFAIVWWMERKTVRRVLRLEGLQAGQWLALAAFVLVLAALGMGMQAGQNYNSTADSFWLRLAAGSALVCSLMHFWYDSFIWSVRRKQV